MIASHISSYYNRLRQVVKANALSILVSTGIVLAVLIVFIPVIVVKIPVGFNGVIYRPLNGGVDLTKVYGEGLHLKFPWETITTYNVQIQHDFLQTEVMTSDLLKSDVKVSFQYEVYGPTLPLLHKYVGKDYLKKIILPKVASAARGNIAKYTSSQAFTEDFHKMENEIIVYADSSMVGQLSPAQLTNVRLLVIKDVQVADIQFPKTYEAAIDEKLVQKAKADAYVFKIEAETQEAKRKVIEAEGIRKFQEIVNAGLTDNFLRFKGIEATKDLANSNNSKVVVFGQGNSGLPLIMGDLDKSGSKSK